MYKLEYFLRKINDQTYAADYKLFQNGRVIEERTYTYNARTPIKHFNDANARIKGIISLDISRRLGINNKTIAKVCTNPKEDFLTRSEMAQRYWTNRANEIYGEQAVLIGEAQEIIETPITTDRLYEVVEVGGVWTIKKHDSKWFTAEEAKTQLFAHVVNGD
jgi:hypothetical protein